MVIVPDHQPVEEYPFVTKTILFSNGDNQDSQLDFNFPCSPLIPVAPQRFTN